MKKIRNYTEFLKEELSPEMYSKIMSATKDRRFDDNRSSRIHDAALTRKYGNLLDSTITVYNDFLDDIGNEFHQSNDYGLSVTEDGDNLKMHLSGTSIDIHYNKESDTFEVEVPNGKIKLNEFDVTFSKESVQSILDIVKIFNPNTKATPNLFPIESGEKKTNQISGGYDAMFVKYGPYVIKNWNDKMRAHKYAYGGDDTKIEKYIPIEINIPSIYTGIIKFTGGYNNSEIMGIQEEDGVLKFTGGGAGWVEYDPKTDKVYVNGIGTKDGNGIPEADRVSVNVLINCIKRFNPKSKIEPKDFNII